MTRDDRIWLAGTRLALGPAMTGVGIRMRAAHNRCAPIPGGTERMRHRRHDEADDADDPRQEWQADRHHRVRPRRREREPETPEQKILRQAQRRANAQIGFLIHAVAWATVCFFLLLVAG